MSLSGFMWDISQEERIQELEDRVKELEEQMGMAAKWINYLREQQNERTNNRGDNDLARPDVGSKEAS